MIWRNLPPAIQWLIFPVVMLGANGLPVAPMLLFSLTFPKPLLHRRWAWIILVVLLGPWLVFTATLDYTLLFAPERAAGTFPDWLAAAISIDFLTSFLASVVILAVNYFRLREVNERRRIRLVVFGLLLFLVYFVVFFLLFLFQRTDWLSTFAVSPLAFGLLQVPFTICVAYAVLKQATVPGKSHRTAKSAIRCGAPRSADSAADLGGNSHL